MTCFDDPWDDIQDEYLDYAYDMAMYEQWYYESQLDDAEQDATDPVTEED